MLIEKSAVDGGHKAEDMTVRFFGLEMDWHFLDTAYLNSFI